MTAGAAMVNKSIGKCSFFIENSYHKVVVHIWVTDVLQEGVPIVLSETCRNMRAGSGLLQEALPLNTGLILELSVTEDSQWLSR